MNVIQFLVLILFFSIGSVNAQEKEFLNEVLNKNEKDSIFLVERYITDYGIDIKYFDESNFKEWWSEMPGPDTPSLQTFFSNFNLKQFQSKLASNKNDSLIDFGKLDKTFIKVKQMDIKKINQQIQNGANLSYQKNLAKSFLHVSKPIFNDSKDWAVVIKTSENPYLKLYDGGQLQIYQKLNCKWQLYHKFYLWLN